MVKTVLITGGYGFLGRATALMFKAQGFRVVGIGNGRWDYSESSSFGFDAWLDARVTMSGLLTLKESFDVIIHCAGNGSVGYSLSNPLQDFMKSVEGAAELLEYVRLKNPEALVIYPSSAGVYGAKDDAPINELDVLQPISPYGYHKKIVEELCESYSRTYGLKIAIIRFFSVYGPGLTKQLLWDASSKLVARTDHAIFWGTGDETRDWINIDDATALIRHISSDSEAYKVVNGACGIRITVREVLEILRIELGSSVKIKFNNTVRGGDPRFYHADVSKAHELGWRPRISLCEGVKRYAKWFKNINGSS